MLLFHVYFVLVIIYYIYSDYAKSGKSGKSQTLAMVAAKEFDKWTQINATDVRELLTTDIKTTALQVCA